MEKNIVTVISNENKSVTPYETTDAIKNAGFKDVFIQWYDRDTNPTQEEQLKYARECGLNVIFAHLGYDGINNIWLDNNDGKELVKRYQNDIKTCKGNGISLVVMHLVDGTTAPQYNEIGLKRIKEIVDYAEALDVKVAFENTKIKGYLEYVLENIKNENAGICFDSGHYHAFFNDEFDFTKFKNKVFAVHLHDNDKSGDLHLIPFDGTIDWEKLLVHLKECNYNGPITLELCYRCNYLNMGVEKFYQEGYKVGEELRDMDSKIKK